MDEESTAASPLDRCPTGEGDSGIHGRELCLFNRQNLACYRASIDAGLDLVERRIAATERPFTGITPAELDRAFEKIDLDCPCAGMAEALAEVDELYLEDAVYFHHPKYVAHLNCPITLPSILAELILSSINSSLDTWDQSAGATLIEQKLVAWTAARIGLGANADGVFTSGGTQSNLMAMLLARDSVRTGPGRASPDSSRLRIFASEVSHFSIQKAAAILGLGAEAVISVPCDAGFQMDQQVLEQALRRCRARGDTPMAVVATAGTTDFGSIDPLPDIAAICRAHDVWLHIDAAYGCGLLVSPTRRHWLDGIESADSVTVDYHKSFYQPVSCSALLVRDTARLSLVTCHAEYLNPASQARQGTPNQVDKSIQTTRRFDALKLWLTLRTVGADTLGAAFDRAIELASETAHLLHAEPALEMAHRPRLSTIVFRYRGWPGATPEAVDAANAHIRQSLSRTGEAIIGGTRIGKRRYLKFTLLNPDTELADMRETVALITHHAARYAERHASHEQRVAQHV